jgi:hypothetical protein
VFGWGRNRPIFALSTPLRRRFTQRYTGSTRGRDSSGRGRRPLEPNETVHILDKVSASPPAVYDGPIIYLTPSINWLIVGHAANTNSLG